MGDCLSALLMSLMVLLLILADGNTYWPCFVCIHNKSKEVMIQCFFFVDRGQSVGKIGYLLQKDPGNVLTKSLILRIFLRNVVFLRKILRIRIFLFTKIFSLRIILIFLRMAFTFLEFF